MSKSNQSNIELGALTTDQVYAAIDGAFRLGQELHGAGEESTTAAVTSLVTGALTSAMSDQ